MEIHRAEPVLVTRICPARVKRTAEVGEIFGAVICRHCAVDLCNGQAKQIVLGRRIDAGAGLFLLRAAAVGMIAAGDGAVAVVILGVVALPDGVDGLGAVFMFNGNRAARLILRSGRSRTVSLALEGVAFLGRGLIGDGKGSLCRRCRQ